MQQKCHSVAKQLLKILLTEGGVASKDKIKQHAIHRISTTCVAKLITCVERIACNRSIGYGSYRGRHTIRVTSLERDENNVIYEGRIIMQAEKNIWLSMLSMLLTLALLIACVPNQVYALAGEALADLLEQEAAESIETPNETKHGVYEVTELREANVKHFALEDGTYTAVMYGSTVHTQDAEGNWQDIDNRLEASGSEFSTSNARIKFAKKITGNPVSPTTRACSTHIHRVSDVSQPAISSSVVPFSSCLQSFPESESFSLSQSDDDNFLTWLHSPKRI